MSNLIVRTKIKFLVKLADTLTSPIRYYILWIYDFLNEDIRKLNKFVNSLT